MWFKNWPYLADHESAGHDKTSGRMQKRWGCCFPAWMRNSSTLDMTSQIVVDRRCRPGLGFYDSQTIPRPSGPLPNSSRFIWVPKTPDQKVHMAFGPENLKPKGMWFSEYGCLDMI